MKEEIKKILASYSLKLNKEEQFNHILKEIAKHDSKLKTLKENEDKPGHFKEEVCDVYILASLLMELEQVDQKQLDQAAQHVVDKVKDIYGG